MRVIILNILAPVLSLLASAGLGLAGLELKWLQSWLWLDGPWGFVFVCVVVLFAAGAVAPWLSLRDRSRVEGALIANIKRTLVPAATKLMSAVHRQPEINELEASIIAVLHNLRSFVGGSAAHADANLYALEGEGRLGTRLVRLHGSDTDARAEFKKTKGTSPRQIEEAAAVDRVLNGEYAFCPDVRNQKQRQLLKIEERRPNHQYVAFMSVPVMHENKPIGMLSVNATRTNLIKEVHQDYLNAVAKLLSVFHEARNFEGMIKEREALGEVVNDD